MSEMPPFCGKIYHTISVKVTGREISNAEWVVLKLFECATSCDINFKEIVGNGESSSHNNASNALYFYYVNCSLSHVLC